MAQAAIRQSRRISWKAVAIVLTVCGIGLAAGLALRSAIPLLTVTPRCAFVYLDRDLSDTYTPAIDSDLSADKGFRLVMTDSADEMVYQGMVEGCRLPRDAANSRL